MLKTQITGAKYLSPQTNQMTNLNIAVPSDSKDTEFGTSDILLAKDTFKAIEGDVTNAAINAAKNESNTAVDKLKQPHVTNLLTNFRYDEGYNNKNFDVDFDTSSILVEINPKCQLSSDEFVDVADFVGGGYMYKTITVSVKLHKDNPDIWIIKMYYTYDKTYGYCIYTQDRRYSIDILISKGGIFHMNSYISGGKSPFRFSDSYDGYVFYLTTYPNIEYNVDKITYGISINPSQINNINYNDENKFIFMDEFPSDINRYYDFNPNAIYLVKKENSTDPNVHYDKYIWIPNDKAFEKIG